MLKYLVYFYTNLHAHISDMQNLEPKYAYFLYLCDF